MKRYELTADERLALGTFIKLVRATDSFTARTHTHLDAAQLTASQFGVLDAIYHLGPLHLKELAEKILKTGGNLTMVVNNLELRDLVRRKQNSNDKRFFCIHLTKKGLNLFKKVFPIHVRAITKGMAVLSAEEQEELSRICRKLGHNR